MQRGDGLHSFDQPAESGQPDDQRYGVGPRVSCAAQHGQNRKGEYVLDLVRGSAGQLRWVRQHGHHEGNRGCKPEAESQRVAQHLSRLAEEERLRR